MHVVTDNAANYMAVGKLSTLHYKNIYWNPYVAHTINLILKDICVMPHVSDIAKKSFKVMVFVYNHDFVLITTNINLEGDCEVGRY